MIYYDRLVDPEVLDLARRDAERVYVGKEPGCHHWPQDKICNVIVAAARQGKRVVRLKCGDPAIFARGKEETDALLAANIPFEIVPGVTAASGASAAMNGFLTERGSCDTMIFATGRTEIENTSPRWLSALGPGTRVALYMGVASAGDISKQLTSAGFEGFVKIDIVANAQRSGQIIASCRPSTLEATIEEHGISNPAILFLSWSSTIVPLSVTTRRSTQTVGS